MLDTREPVLLDPFREYTIGSFALEECMAGKSAEEVYSIFKAMGVLPLGSVGKSSYAALAEGVSALAERIGEERPDDPVDPVDVDLDLDGTRLVGRLDNMWKNGRIQYRYANLKAKHRLELWINHLVLNCLEDSNLPKTSIWIGRDPHKKVIGTALAPIEDIAGDILSKLVHIYWLGQTQPLRFFPDRSFSYAKSVLQSDLAENDAKSKAYKDALDAWEDTYNNYESQDPAIIHAFGDQHPIANREHDGENKFGELALSIFTPLIQHTREAGR
jgi:exodeoxyribonuclease V gamma subunit